MRTKVQKWGKSLAIRIPKLLALEVGWLADSDIEMSIQEGSLVLSPARREDTQEELGKGITAANRREEIDLGPPVGREIL
jgi:antitoxin MazE